MRLPAMLYDRRHDLKYILWLPVYLVSFVVLEHLIDGSGRYWATQISLDRFIPFCEFFVIPYCLWYPLLVAVGLYLLFRDSAAFRRYMRFLAVTFFLSELIWFLIPNGQDLRPVVMPRDNFFSRWVAALYSIDTSTNVFPSVHVVGSVGAAGAVWNCYSLREHRRLRYGTVILAVLICHAVYQAAHAPGCHRRRGALPGGGRGHLRLYAHGRHTAALPAPPLFKPT